MKRKYAPRVYAILRDADLSNREIAELLGVNESSVRRGLAKVPVTSEHPAADEFRNTPLYVARTQDIDTFVRFASTMTEVLDRLDALERRGA